MTRALTTREVAEMLRVTTKTVREMALDGRLPCFRIGKLYRFDARRVHAIFFADSPKGERSLKIERDFKLASIQSHTKEGVIEWL